MALGFSNEDDAGVVNFDEELSTREVDVLGFEDENVDGDVCILLKKLFSELNRGGGTSICTPDADALGEGTLDASTIQEPPSCISTANTSLVWMSASSRLLFVSGCRSCPPTSSNREAG